MQKVYDAAESTKLFQPEEIKVRINPFEYYNNGNSKDNFIHVLPILWKEEIRYKKLICPDKL